MFDLHDLFMFTHSHSDLTISAGRAVLHVGATLMTYQNNQALNPPFKCLTG